MTDPRHSRRRWTDSGQVAGIEVLPFGFLIFVVGTLLLANAWAVVDAKLAVTAASREATRAYVESGDGPGAEVAATEAARASISGHGRDPDRVSVIIDVDGGFRRCAIVVTAVQLEVPSVVLPFIGGFGRRFEVRATHSEIVDPYRSGLGGEADCG